MALGTVVTMCPTSSRPSLRGKHSSRITPMSRDSSREGSSGLFEELDYLFAANARKIVEEFIDRISVLQIISQILNWNPRTGENRSPAKYLGIADDKCCFHRTNGSCRFHAAQCD